MRHRSGSSPPASTSSSVRAMPCPSSQPLSQTAGPPRAPWLRPAAWPVPTPSASLNVAIVHRHRVASTRADHRAQNGKRQPASLAMPRSELHQIIENNRRRAHFCGPGHLGNRSPRRRASAVTRGPRRRSRARVAIPPAVLRRHARISDRVLLETAGPAGRDPTQLQGEKSTASCCRRRLIEPVLRGSLPVRCQIDLHADGRSSLRPLPSENPCSFRAVAVHRQA